jgi:Tol biopolymer transport system component
LVFRASRPKTPEEIKEYKDFLAQGLVAPVNMEIFTCNVDGSDMKQVTHLGKANWAPYFTPDGKKIIFSSNHASKKGYDFHPHIPSMWMVQVWRRSPRRVTLMPLRCSLTDGRSSSGHPMGTIMVLMIPTSL